MDKESEYNSLSAWFKQSPGKYYLALEQQQLDALLVQFHGYFFVQLGFLECYDLRVASESMDRIYVGRGTAEKGERSLIESNFSELPFQYESTDAFFLPHTLEFTNKPDNLIREIYHILIPGGRIIIMGFNPFSLFGLTKLLKSAKNVPWSGKLHSLSHVKFWLRANGFTIDYQKTFCFRPPTKNQDLLEKLGFLETLGQCCWPHFGSAYILVGLKKTALLSPLKKKYVSKKIPVTSGFPEPSTNKGL